MSRIALPALAALALLTAAGCIQHHSVSEGEMDRLWTLSPDPTQDTEAYRPEVAGTKLPARWIIRSEPSLLRSTISIVRAVDAISEGAEVIDVSVSPEHAEVLAGVLADTRGALTGLEELSSGTAAVDYADWADTLAHVLAQLESVSRMAVSDGGQTQREPVGLSAAPLLELLVVYMNEQSGGQLLGGLDADDVQELRQTLGHLALRMGFAMAGRELPDGLRERVTERLRQAEAPYAVEPELARMLLKRVREAGTSAGGDALVSGVQSAISAAGRGIRVLEGFATQWDRVERVEAALLRKGDRTIFEAVLAVRPDREVRLATVMPFQPVVAFRGTSRLAVLPSDPRTGEVVVSFERGEDGGGVQMRFEGLVYGLARLLVLPISDAWLREVRVLADLNKTGTGMIHTAVMLEATGDRRDPRRTIVYKEVRHRRVERRAMSVRYPVTSKIRTFSYVTPGKRYTYYSAERTPEP